MHHARKEVRCDDRRPLVHNNRAVLPPHQTATSPPPKTNNTTRHTPLVPAPGTRHRPCRYLASLLCPARLPCLFPQSHYLHCAACPSRSAPLYLHRLQPSPLLYYHRRCHRRCRRRRLCRQRTRPCSCCAWASGALAEAEVPALRAPSPARTNETCKQVPRVRRLKRTASISVMDVSTSQNYDGVLLEYSTTQS